jgi:D-sedoheptulose 7-phosphate isomerase
MEAFILNILKDSIETKERSIKKNIGAIVKAADVIIKGLAVGRKVLLFGNGGSAADAQHIAAEFINRFQMERPPLAAIALTTDTSVLTSISNDYHFDEVFSKQIRALGKEGDIAVGFSTSGNSVNVVKGMDAAKMLNMHTIGFSGRGGKLAECADIVLTVESDVTARVQETHIVMGHILCDIVEKTIFDEDFTKA